MVRIVTKQKNAARQAQDRPRLVSRLVAQRVRFVVALAVVAGLGWGMQGVWHHVAPQISQRENYLLTEQRIAITPLPEWITSDVRAEVVRNAGLIGRLSVLDDAFAQVIEDAFVLHPWIESVDRITKSYPAGAQVELTYRRPVAAVELVSDNVVQLVPIDRYGVHLPAADVPNIRKRYLPRIGGIVERPPEGQPWSDPRVLGAAELAERLAPDWESLHLVDILPSARPEIRERYRYYIFDLITRGGTRVVWGAAPSAAPPSEDEFAAKVGRLKDFSQQNGLLDSVTGPKIVDVRRGLAITPRSAKKSSPRTAKKPKHTEEDSDLVK